MDDDLQRIRERFGIVGRRAELERGLAAVHVNRHLMIEGPVGVGKTVLANAIASYLDRPVFRVDGDERYTEQKLSGWFDPPVVLEKGYVEDAFLLGPLTEAMRAGGVLFVNEMNRMPEGVQNILLPAMDEGIIDIPKVGRIRAKEGFVIIATQNPREFVATTAISEALSDRFELLTLNYQPEGEEFEIIARRYPAADGDLVARSLWICRRTRDHPNIRRGASIRGAIATVQLAGAFGSADESALRRAAQMALPTRIEMREESKTTAPEVIDQIVDECLAEAPSPPTDMDTETTRGDPGRKGRPADGERKVIDVGDIAKLLETHHEDKLLDDDDIGWKVAQNYMRIRIGLSDPAALELARKIAIRATIQRVLRLLGPVRLPSRVVREPFLPGDGSEIDIESTVENIAGKRRAGAADVVVERREPKDLSVALMLDASLSMSGDKLAMASAAIAVLAFRLTMVDFLLVTFNDRPKVVKRLDQDFSLDDLVMELLEFTAPGYTNIESALVKGHEELSKARTRNQVGVLITDGNYTVGRDPSLAASSFKRLFVIMTHSHDCRLGVCEAVAGAGGGHVYEVSGFDEVPRVLYKVLRVVAQGSPG
ncbi:MAG: AAA family ATPase [Methanobacteriota archaeon]|nr:MAG: AAA family ATPase [Euryarchaeota archaeon]